VLVPRIYLRVFEQSYIEQACSESDRDPLRGSPVNSRKAIADLAALELIDGMPDEWKRKLSTVYLDRLARAK